MVSGPAGGVSRSVATINTRGGPRIRYKDTVAKSWPVPEVWRGGLSALNRWQRRFAPKITYIVILQLGGGSWFSYPGNAAETPREERRRDDGTPT